MIVNRIANRFESILDRVHLRRAPQLPSQIHMSVTDRCFLPCLHCDIWKNEAVDLPTEKWLQVIDKLGRWCSPAGINFVGGEPLLRKDLGQLIFRAHSLGFETSFNTNGWLVTKERSIELSEAQANVVYVSLDGLNRETIDHSRGREGSFEKAMQAVEYFSQLPNPRVVIASILHAHNASEMISLLNWVQDRGLQMVVQPLYQNFGDVEYDENWWKKSELWPKQEQDLVLIEEALDALTIARMKGKPICNEASQLQAMKFHFRYPNKDTGVSCRAGHSDISFDPQGRIRLCYFLDSIGHIDDETPFPVVWEQWHTLRRRWEVSRCSRHCSLLNCNFET
jgi:MoaA/NifB/PqqE/SkfB family radical SAM enzyme